jgi:hypothetical protein
MVDAWYGTCLCRWYGHGFGIHVSGSSYGWLIRDKDNDSLDDQLIISYKLMSQ